MATFGGQRERRMTIGILTKCIQKDISRPSCGRVEVPSSHPSHDQLMQRVTCLASLGSQASGSSRPLLDPPSTPRSATPSAHHDPAHPLTSCSRALHLLIDGLEAFRLQEELRRLLGRARRLTRFLGTRCRAMHLGHSSG